MHLRGTRGRLRASAQSSFRKDKLPTCNQSKTKVLACSACSGKKNECFFAGDFRVNEQLNLIVIHTLFMREHNRVASQLAALNPDWDSETIYQEARRVTVAKYQHIV